MTPERWRRITDVFHAARVRDVAVREAFLDQECGSDRDLRGEIEALLAAHQQARSFGDAAVLPITARSAMPLAAGSRLGPYEILAPLGTGAMGEVYRARDTRLRREVALKTLPPLPALDPDRRARFEQEARAASSLNHPNIVSVLDIGEASGVAFLVMEQVEGSTLREVVARGTVPLRKQLDIACQIAEGLAKAHEAGIVHRDLKPENVMLSKDGFVKILDFGVAKLGPELSGLPAGPLTAAGVLVGTAGYMSPEQARGAPVDFRSDQFSLGTILFEMITGRHPFDRSSKAETLAAIIAEDAEDVSRLNPRAPAPLRWLIARCLAKDPGDRYAATRDLARELATLRDHLTDAVTPAVGETTTRRARFPVAVSSLALAAGLFAGAAVDRLASSPAAPEVLDYQQLTSDGRAKSGFTASGLPFALATDGSRVYFMEGGGGGFGLAQVSTAGGEVAAIPQPFPQGQIFDISMDRSEFLLGAFISTETEAPLTILPLPAGPLRRVGDVLAHDATWSPDGKRIAYIEGRDLYVTGHDGAERRKLATLAGVAYWPRWSPDGNVLRLTVLDPKTSSPSLWEVSVDGARSRPLFAGWNDPPAECCGSWTADGRDFVFQSTRNGKTHIWAVPERRGPFRMSTSEPTQVTSGPMMFLAPLASHDGRRLFALGVQPRGELVRYDAASKHFVPFLSGISADAIDFSGDGEWVAYVAVPEGTLWRSRADGRDRVRLTSPPMTAALPRWSPDGQQIAFFAKAPGRPWKIHFVSRGGGSPQQAIPGESHESDPSWSPDGRSLAFAGAPWTEGYAPASTAIHLLHLGTRTVSTLPGSEGLFSPRWSPDGRYIAALPADQHGLRLFDFRTRQWTDLGNLNVNYPSWSRDGRYIYFDVVSATEPEFLRIRVADRKVERIVSLKGFRRASGALAMWAGIAPDDSPLLLRDIGTQEIYALDWHAP